MRLNLGRVKAGFVGTLDPLASGCLPIAVGHATKVINLAEKVDKEYIFTICWGHCPDYTQRNHSPLSGGLHSSASVGLPAPTQ